MSRITEHATRVAFRALASTWRFEVHGGEHHDAVRGRPFVYALWHHTLLPLLWWHRQRDITLLVSRHRDAAPLASAAMPLGYRLSRGSSTRGGAAGLRSVLRDLDEGRAVAITPDGPAGPARHVKPGVIRAARRAGVPILPVAACVDRAWRLRSWDRLLVPHPFARIRVCYGPLLLPNGADERTAGALLGATLDRLARTASRDAA